MRRSFATTCFLLTAFLLSGCWKEYSYEGGVNSPVTDTSRNNEPPVKSEWEFKEGAAHYAGPVDTAYLMQEDVSSVLTVTGKSASSNEKLSLIIRGPGKIEKGKTYRSLYDQAKFIYEGQDIIYQAKPYAGGDLYVTITDIEEHKVKGTFKGLAVKENRTYEIKEGKFSSPLKRVPLSEARGYIMLWAHEGCNGPIKVKVNNQWGEITSFSRLTPECGETGRATFSFKPGTYNWVAYCGGDSLSGTAELKAGRCARILLEFPIKPAPHTNTEITKTCKLSGMDYSGELFPLMPNIIKTYYANNTPVEVTHVTKIHGFSTPPIPFKIIREGNKILVPDPHGQKHNVFVTDSKGRVIEYHGNTTPDDYPQQFPEYVTYEYDQNNNLIKRTYFRDAERRPINELVFTWKDGNISQITQKSFITGNSVTYYFEYFPGKEIKAMPFFFHQAMELLIYQSVLNLGNSVKNLPKKMIMDVGHNKKDEFSFYQYILDDNNYVLSMQLSLDAYPQKAINFNFEYTCF